MEYRIVLSDTEAYELADKLKFITTEYIKDEYTGKMRIRKDAKGVRKKAYETPVNGVIHKFTSLCELGSVKDI